MSNKEEIKIHYNVFETIKEQINERYEIEDIEIFEKAKNNILFLWLHNILSDSEKERCFSKLHKQIIKKIKEVQNVK